MPQNESLIGFKFGSQESYNTKPQSTNIAYYTTDTNRFFIGSTEYTRPVEMGNDLPTNAVKNSLFIKKGDGDERTLYHTADGTNWTPVGIIPKSIEAGIVGLNINKNLDFGGGFVIPKIQYDERGFIVSAENQDIKLPDVKISDETLSFND